MNPISISAIISIALAFHGLALAVLILVTGKWNRLTITYSSLLLVLSLILVEYFFSYSGLEVRMPHLIAIKIPLLTLIGPLYFLWSTYKAGKRTVLLDILHFIPFIVVGLLLVPFYGLPASEKVNVAASDSGFLIRNFYLVSTFLHLFFYVFLTRYLTNEKDYKRQDERLLKQLHIGFVLLLSVFGLAIVYSLVGTTGIGSGRFLFILGLGVLINLLAYVLLKTPNSFMTKPRTNDPEINLLATKVQHYLVTEKPYLNKGFSKGDLSNALDSNENYISRAFNDILKKSFSSYMNELRVEEAKRLLISNDDKIYAIALDSGFASKNNFTRVFKQLTNHTPAEFRMINRINRPQFTN